MRGFDVLDPDLPLFQNYFLEASAGTGKTFAIENLVLRLLQEGLTLDQILVVTFTRAATVELKERIRSKLPPELLAQFDEAKIWTIHSFCFHMLQEQALETGFSLAQVEESAGVELTKQIVKDFLRTSTLLTPKQLAKVMRGDPEGLVNQLAATAGQRLPIETPDWDYTGALESLDPERLLEDLIALAPQYGKLCNRQKQVKPDVLAGLKRFTSLLAGEKVDPVDLPILKYVEENKLKRAVQPEKLHYPGLLERLQTELIPKLALFSDSTVIFAHLAEQCRRHLERVIEQEELIFFEDLIRLMAKHVEEPAFAQRVRGQFRAVLIDEFQDTDPLQWKIFSTLFSEGPLYLVGDPKQSIYRFRSADLYTYLAAKQRMGEETHASLQTNFRSTPPLVEELNALFARPFIPLPKTGEMLECPPVEAASPLEPLADGKGAVHYLIAEDEATLFSTIVHEIARLDIPLRECAVLVNDRHQAERFMAACPLPTVSKRSRSLLDSPAFETLLELLRAASNPRDPSAIARVLAGPLFGHSIEALPDEQERFYRYHHLLESEGILPFFQTVVEESNLSDGMLYQDLLQLVEKAAHYKGEYLPFYHRLMQLDPDSEELRARATVEEEAIQVMTIHVSKGLEFSVVFPIGVAAPYRTRKGLVRSDEKFVLSDPLAEAEERSEKMRQLYVAFTRAKQRLYIPVLENHSPVTTFLEGVDLTEKSQEVCQHYPPPTYVPKRAPQAASPTLSHTYAPSTIHSFSSLVHYEPEPMEIPEGILPVGAQTGTLIHELFEELPFEEAFKASSLLPFVRKHLRGTLLERWTEEVEAMVRRTLHQPLPGPDGAFPLSVVDPQKIIKEMEFLFPSDEPQGYFKGFVDLFFEYEGGYYVIDWKTNYVESSARAVVEHHQYDLQAAIYQNAIERYVRLFDSRAEFKGSFYIFLRTGEVEVLTRHRGEHV